MKLKEREFSEKDQINFASFSGDINPIHVNEKEARKTIAGQRIVHGIHASLWLLESLFQRQKIFYGHYKVRFLNQVNLNHKVQAIWDKTNERLELIGKNKEILVSVTCGLPIEVDRFKRVINSVETEGISREPKRLSIADVDVGHKIDQLFGGRKELSANLFPTLSEFLGEDLVYEISLLSNIVGMEIPGLNSLFIGLEVRLKEGGDRQTLTVEAVDDRFGFVTLDYLGKNIDAEIEAFFRPPPVVVPPCKALRKQISSLPDLNGVRALIVGGSRGLGAWVAKVIALAGGDVTITYNVGKDEAQLISKDILSIGGRCNVIRLDVSERLNVDALEKEFDQLYYFATPKISMNKMENVDENLYAKFYEFYVQGFEAISEFCIKLGVTRIMYPSTVFIDKPRKEFSEYIKAKAEGEKVCDSLEGSYSVIVFKPRIPPVETDQTASVIPVKTSQPLDVVISFVRQMSSKG